MPDQSVTDSTAASAQEHDGQPLPYVIAVGASAGGLDALERFFQALPVQTGAAFVVIQHLSPDHKSMMGNLLGRYTSIPVTTVEDGMPIEPDHIYLIPPASMMSVSGNELHLRPKSPRGLALPIDLFFSSLARAYKNRAIGVILSGTGSDGTRGAVAINDAGGLLLAQDPESAKFDGMPRSVIATGLVDAILPPEELGPRILDHISHAPSRRTPARSTAVSYDREGALEEALHLLHHQGGINFRDYKPATVMRRIERRMQVRHVPDLDNYVRLLDGDIGELHALRRELLIPVTNFFRDSESFEALAEKVITPIVKEHTENQPIRVWVPGVSTGEEAYSIAILFAEAFDKLRRWPDFKLFATDVEQHNVDTGSAGMFSESIAAEVSPARLERFFYKRGNHYVVKNDIRHNIVFAKHNLLEDPPFTRMDLISCRNLLIYFRNDAQERALRRLQYALAPGGYLFLGSSETISSVQRDFSAVSSKHKLYRVLRHGSPPLESNLPHGRLNVTSTRASTQRTRANSDAAAIDAGQAALLRGYAPISLLLNSNQELMHVFGDVSRYLSIGEGTVSLDIGKLLPPSLAPVAQALLHKVMVSREPLRSDIVQVNLPNEQTERLRLVVRHVPQDGGDGWLLLSFEPEPELAAEATADEAAVETMDMDAESADRLQTLERELAVTRESLQATIEELETANEELQATNEELMASNEELQSSNEELQSVNEELYTVNSENQEKIEILNRLNADLDSMAKAAAIATVFVDHELKLTRFTPEANKLFKIREADLGRSIDDFTNLLDYPDFYAELKKTIEDGEMLQREVTATNDRVYLARVLPYAVREGAPRGAVATFVDVTTLRDIERMQAVLDSLPEHIAVLDVNGRITMINSAWREFACSNGDPNLQASGPGSSYLDACQSGANATDAEYAKTAAEGLQALLQGELEDFSMQYPCHSPEVKRWFVMHAAPIKHPARGVVVSHIDVSAWNRDQKAD